MKPEKSRKKKAPRKGAKEILSQRLVRQWLRGQKAMNKITQAERHAWLQRLTVEEARQVFEDLHGNADDWKRFGGNSLSDS